MKKKSFSFLIIFAMSLSSFSFGQSTNNYIIPGWPSYLAMGTITNGAPQEPTNIRVDAVFTYNGAGGDGDPGTIETPYKIWNMINMAKNIKKNTGHAVNPVLVEYGWQLSGGWNPDSVTNLDDLTKHFFNLMFLAKTLEANAYSNTGTYGTILLNPDMLGYLGNTNRVEEVKSLYIPVNKAVSNAYCMMSKKVNFSPATTPTCTYGWDNKPVVINGTPTDLLLWLKSKTDNYTAGQAFATCVNDYVIPLCGVANPDQNIPGFSDNFNGWLHAQNWMAKYFGPHVALGVHENISAVPEGGWWIHRGPTAVKPYVDKVLADLKSFELFSSKYKPDFIYFDRYGADDYSSKFPNLLINQATFYNDAAWQNFLTMTQQMSEGLGKQAGKSHIPVMLWQIPAAHIPTQDEPLVEAQEEGSAPVYFFGDSKLQRDLSNIASWINMDIANLPKGYSLCAGKNATQCLTLNNFNWAHNNTEQLKKAVDAHIFAILWGAGAFATGVWEVPGTTFPDNGWMAKKLSIYYKKPTTFAKN
ncbi:hypothetical protein [Fluoribacter gormanii]|uniref:Uncharacterized protein n=1 Tax=Fluoribacter gormanii TaxID=464 RepID=A0A377GM95_9GAMM|nr:hypothetical protein [Fluoribacter gormanii]KTD05703.1 hypothetical protein Lgor_0188 [Fluoribacter gormanii]SIQ63154.1 hypothetical protein SAMN05421777_10287 [Fluoribacter gormanii]STO25878.1 Uncharacterised protein [Fluoribacter gormanii]